MKRFYCLLLIIGLVGCSHFHKTECDCTLVDWCDNDPNLNEHSCLKQRMCVSCLKIHWWWEK